MITQKKTGKEMKTKKEDRKGRKEAKYPQGFLQNNHRRRRKEPLREGFFNFVQGIQHEHTKMKVVFLVISSP